MVKVSVIIPIYNGEKYIRGAIDSILNQTYQDFEIIAIDDGSIDNTSKILKEYGNKIKWKSQENNGQASAINKAIKMAKGEYIALLDSDDIYLPNKLEKQINYLDKHQNIGLVYSNYYLVNEDEKIIRMCRSNEPDDIILMQKNFIPRSTVLHRKKCIDEVGMYDESISGNDDWDMWIRISEKFKLGFMDEPLLKYRMHGKNISLTRPNRLDHEAKLKIQIYEKAYERKGKPTWLKFKIIRAKIERKIRRKWPLSDERLSGFWWRADKLVDIVERIFIKKIIIILLKDIFIPKKTGLYKYMDYNEYKKIQIEGNIEGIDSDRVWATENNIKFLSNFLERNVSNLKFGICHGTRQGKEQEWFSKYLGIPVIGTEISPTASMFPNTIQWDFHIVKDEWVNNVDFIYSNSFDHSYNPEACLDAWMKCITKEGLLILEWTPEDIEYNELDPFGATLKNYKKLISKKYKLIKILKSPDNRFWRLRRTYFLIVSHKKEKS